MSDVSKGEMQIANSGWRMATSNSIRTSACARLGSSLFSLNSFRRSVFKRISNQRYLNSGFKPSSDLRRLISSLGALPFALSFLGALFFAFCSFAEAQQPKKVFRIGFL